MRATREHRQVVSKNGHGQYQFSVEWYLRGTIGRGAIRMGED